MRVVVAVLLICLAGCSWFHHKPHGPDPAILVVTGAPAGALLYIDGAHAGQESEARRPQMLDVTPGTHIVEVKVGDTITYRENTYVAAGEKRVIQVLSGARD